MPGEKGVLDVYFLPLELPQRAFPCQPQGLLKPRALQPQSSYLDMIWLPVSVDPGPLNTRLAGRLAGY